MQPHDTTNQIPYGFCHCGCGQKTTVANQNHSVYGWIKGEPVRFVRGHGNRARQKLANPNPSGSCMCGCGQKTPIAKANNCHKGYVKGQPLRYVHGHGRGNGNLVSAFWKHCTSGNPTECWEWQGTTRNGYGVLRVRRQFLSAHRVSYELHKGPIPQKMLVCHACDNPRCVNPLHLWIGTDADNLRDMREKGRAKDTPMRGEQNGFSKLSNDDVAHIRQRYAQGLGYTKIAREFQIARSHVRRIVRREVWKHVG